MFDQLNVPFMQISLVCAEIKSGPKSFDEERQSVVKKSKPSTSSKVKQTTLKVAFESVSGYGSELNLN